VGCIGLHLSGGQAEVHNEMYRARELEIATASALWERVLRVAQNHGIHRIWSRGEPRIKERGFVAPMAEDLRELPGAFGKRDEQWFVLKLREAPPTSLAERELELMVQAKTDAAAKTLQRARAIRFVASVIALIILLAVVVALLFLLRKLSGSPPLPK
jgi:hypothetical protein